MRAFSSDTFVLPLPEGHRFPMTKYRRLRERALAEGVLAAEDLRVAEPVHDDDLRRAHDADYIARVVDGRLSRREERRIGFPWSPGLVERSRRSAGATLAASRAALVDGVAANLAGGTHHATVDAGAGFCVFNDAAVAICALQAEGAIDRALVIDCDVHQGDGTAQIFARDSTVFTLSLHGRRNFPFQKQLSDLDVALEDGTGDDDYLAALDAALAQALGWARTQGARLAIYLAGADPYVDDRLGRLALTKAGLAARDRRVLEGCRDADLAVAVTMAGGYAHEVEDIVDIHLETLRLAAGLLRTPRRTAPTSAPTATLL
ncbi:MAG: histone deacetylase [Acidobacteriota bacterium]